MRKKLKDLPLIICHPESRSGPLAEIGLVTFDVQVRGKDYRWSRTHGLVRRQDGANVPIPGTESDAWQQLEKLLLMPPLLSAAISLAMAVMSLDGTGSSAAKSDPQTRKSVQRRRVADKKERKAE